MEDATPITTEYDAWASEPSNILDHVEGVTRNLTQPLTAEEAADASRRRRWPYLVDVQTGHLNARDLCWICAGTTVHSDKRLPEVRACRWCLEVDGRHAAALGFRHLLPLFDWPSPPVLTPSRARQLSTDSRQAISQAWSEVAVLDRWRRETVRVTFERLRLPDGEVVDLADWQASLLPGPARSRGLWADYITTHQPALGRVLQQTGDDA